MSNDSSYFRNNPVSGASYDPMKQARYTEIATFMRAPLATSLDQVDIGLIGVERRSDHWFIDKFYLLPAYQNQGIGGWLQFYNEERLHQALGYRTPCAVFDGEAHGVKKGVDSRRIESILS